MKFTASALIFLLGSSLALFAQAPKPPVSTSTSTDLFVMPGSDFDRPGLNPVRT